MQWDREKFRKMFPNLYREIREGGVTMKVSYRKDLKDPWRGYEPSPEDFVARANNPEKAEEVIDYLERTGRISKEKAAEMRKRLRQKGLEDFGEKRMPGYYFRRASSKTARDDGGVKE